MEHSALDEEVETVMWDARPMIVEATSIAFNLEKEAIN
jgi:hypothetical protein